MSWFIKGIPTLKKPLARDSNGNHSDSTYGPLEPGCTRIFRILHINPHVALEVLAVSLDSCPDFEAISYAWEGQEPSETITCNGQPYLITNTLLNAFRNINGAMDLTWLWCDAISIDQSNLDEKGEQVKNMYRVFRQASRVIVWLGLASSDSDLAMTTIPRIWAKLKPLSETGFEELQDNQVYCVLPPDNDHFWEALCRLGSRPWFQRLWIVQEAALASQLVFLCGQRSV